MLSMLTAVPRKCQENARLTRFFAWTTLERSIGKHFKSPPFALAIALFDDSLICEADLIFPYFPFCSDLLQLLLMRC